MKKALKIACQTFILIAGILDIISVFLINKQNRRLNDRAMDYDRFHALIFQSCASGNVYQQMRVFADWDFYDRTNSVWVHPPKYDYSTFDLKPK